MALHHLLYRCPRCGHDPLPGERDRARCPSCRRTFVRIREGRQIRIVGPDGSRENALVPTLVGDIERLGGFRSSAIDEAGRVEYSADVTLRQAVDEEPLRFRGGLLGFVERLGEGVEGRLTALGDRLRFEERAPVDADVHEWPYSELRAVQTSSSALQIAPAEGGVVQLRFLRDSPYRWEDLVRSLIAEEYRREGRGEILEFQPRIVCA